MTSEDYTTVEKFIAGELSMTEAASFRLRLARDRELAAALADRRQLNAHLRATAREGELRETLDGLNGSYFSRPTSNQIITLRSSLAWGGLVAASLLLFFFMADFFAPPSPGNVYAQFADHPDLFLTVRGEEAAQPVAIEAAYNDKDYARAIELLRPYIAEHPKDDQARLALGISLLEEEQYAEATEIFRNLAGSHSSTTPYANWYLALTAVKQGQDGRAVNFLDLIPASDSFLQVRVSDLREKLEAE